MMRIRETDGPRLSTCGPKGYATESHRARGRIGVAGRIVRLGQARTQPKNTGETSTVSAEFTNLWRGQYHANRMPALRITV